MSRLTQLVAAALGALLIAVALGAAAVDAATYKNTKTGEVLKGTLTTQRINGQNVFKYDDGRTKLVNPDEWTMTDPGPAPSPPEPAPTATVAKPAPTATTAAKTGTASTEKPGEPRLFLIPISGPIESHALLEAFDKAVGEAKKAKATTLVLHMNTPGGRLDVTDKLLKAIEKVEGMNVVAWIQGEDKEALSAGAYICMATQKIYMAPGCTIGAATPYTRSFFGPSAVQEKFMSAFKAKFRSLAQTRGYPAAIADAMVDSRTSVVQIFLDGEPQLVTAEEAYRLQEEHKTDKKFKRGKVVNPPGSLITLTTDEAVEFKICSGVAPTEGDLAKALGVEPTAVTEAKWVPEWIDKTTKERKKQVDDLHTFFMAHWAQVKAFDPNRNLITSPAMQQQYSDKCIVQLKECAKAVTELEKLAKDERYDTDVTQEEIDDMKAEMEAIYARLKAGVSMAPGAPPSTTTRPSLY